MYFFKFIIGVCYGECDLPGAGFEKKILEGMLLTGHTFFNFFGSLYFAKNK